MKASRVIYRTLRFMLLTGVLLTVSACESDVHTMPTAVASEQTFDFQQHIKPIIEQKCIACHACYDAPCQLKMQSAEGIDRGASKASVYDGARLEDMEPTRLSIDAQTTEEWRSREFFSVLEQQLGAEGKREGASIIKNMIDLAQDNPLPINKKIPDDIELGLKRKNYCPGPAEFDDYAKEQPHGGMPLAVTGLTADEASIFSTWLNEGAKLNYESAAIPESEKNLIAEWESWLNSKDKRTSLVARYIFEHLFLGHLYLDNGSGGDTRFYSLIRSYTPSALAPVHVSTVRPFDDPKRPFFYRLKPITETIVHKTHITYRFDQKRLEHFKQLFLQPEWTLALLPGYSVVERSNPFLTFEAIPASIRYRFLLDDAEFFVRNFIRGPVCRGQIATNVIRDQFWVMFEDPKHELYTNDLDYQQKASPYLGLPGEKTSLIDLGIEWIKYSERRNRYLEIREKNYRNAFPKGPELAHIWNGDKTNDNAFLSVFRHHDSASVSKGWIGELPLTTWFMDYPLLERTYYELVASFNVFGSVSHQAQTRLYFDLIRNGAETNFLRLLPAESRDKTYKSWYKSGARIKTEVSYYELDEKTPTSIDYKTEKPSHEILETLLNANPEFTVKNDELNRCVDGCAEVAESSDIAKKTNQLLAQIAAKPAKQLKAIGWLPEVTFLRVDLPGGDYLSYTILRNRRHSNVSFLLGESLRYEEELDSLTIVARPIGSYPNLILKINSTDVGDFITAFKGADTEKSFESIIDNWAVRRMNPQFWNVLHSFTDGMKISEPLQAGIYDINRYSRW